MKIVVSVRQAKRRAHVGTLSENAVASSIRWKARHKAGLSKPELQILMAIRYAPGQTVGDLRESLSMTVPTFARIIGELDKRGLIEREREQVSDKRRRTLTLSEAGTTLTTQITIVLRERLRLAYQSAGPDAVEGARKVMDALVR